MSWLLGQFTLSTLTKSFSNTVGCIGSSYTSTYSADGISTDGLVVRASAVAIVLVTGAYVAPVEDAESQEQDAILISTRYAHPPVTKCVSKYSTTWVNSAVQHNSTDATQTMSSWFALINGLVFAQSCSHLMQATFVRELHFSRVRGGVEARHARPATNVQPVGLSKAIMSFSFCTKPHLSRS